MSGNTVKPTSRRHFLKLAAGTAALGPFFLFPDRALASQKTLKIAKWAHFVPEFDTWFESMARDWGRRHDTRITVDEIPVEQISARATAEITAGKGHDVFIFPSPPAEYYQHVIDHGEIYQIVASKYGSIPQLAYRSTFNVKNKKYFAFADFWAPSPLHFFEDYWGAVGMPLGPVHYGSLRSGGRQLRDKLGIPCGLAFTPTLEGNVTLHTILYAFRAWILNGDGDVLFNKNAFAVGALKYIQVLYQDSGTPDQLTWGPAGNVRAMLARKTSCSSNAISLLRAAERQDPKVASQIWLQPPLIGTNGMGVTALPHATNCSVVWNFAQNQDGAKQFVADLVDSSRTGYEKSLGCNFPIYPKTVPDIIVRLSKDPQADPPPKYTALKDALHWTPNLGVPGFATPAYMEIFNSSLVPRMVQSVLKGERSPEDAAAAAAAEMQRIADKWKQV
ncbi:MAG TPA: twin-arginine translocation signal domain-containing protein [Verrucomicrobiae bacterium]|jgi:multiple sugar transport system substrate-binding protein|nr:twin-arginine translocation signal domain-containing protein [Verrucomicrobiae bacterium]